MNLSLKPSTTWCGLNSSCRFRFSLPPGNGAKSRPVGRAELAGELSALLVPAHRDDGGHCIFRSG
jgi:hypothetical protein